MSLVHVAGKKLWQSIQCQDKKQRGKQTEPHCYHQSTSDQLLRQDEKFIQVLRPGVRLSVTAGKDNSVRCEMFRFVSLILISRRARLLSAAHYFSHFCSLEKAGEKVWGRDGETKSRQHLD